MLLDCANGRQEEDPKEVGGGRKASLESRPRALASDKCQQVRIAFQCHPFQARHPLSSFGLTSPESEVVQSSVLSADSLSEGAQRSWIKTRASTATPAAAATASNRKLIRNSIVDGPCERWIKAAQNPSTSMTAWAKASGASCGILWPMPPVMRR